MFMVVAGCWRILSPTLLSRTAAESFRISCVCPNLLRAPVAQVVAELDIHHPRDSGGGGNFVLLIVIRRLRGFGDNRFESPIAAQFVPVWIETEAAGRRTARKLHYFL
jgi:hypothetical protein